MSQREDFIVRIIRQFVQAMARIAGLIEAGQLDLAFDVVGAAMDDVLGPLRPLVERLEADSVVSVIGTNEIDRVRMYAALVGRRAAIHELRGEDADARACFQRCLELFAVASSGGAVLDEIDVENIRDLLANMDFAGLSARYRDELNSLLAKRTIDGADPPLK